MLRADRVAQISPRCVDNQDDGRQADSLLRAGSRRLAGTGQHQALACKTGDVLHDPDSCMEGVIVPFKVGQEPGTGEVTD